MTATQETGASAEEMLIEQRGHVQWITFNRPAARNALTWNMYDRLVDACEKVNAHREVRAVVFTGAGGQAFGDHRHAILHSPRLHPGARL